MAVKIRILRERIIPVHYETGMEGETYKVNNEVGMELVLAGDAEYVDPELMARFKPEEPKAEVESAAIEPEENAMMPSAKPRKLGRPKRK